MVVARAFVNIVSDLLPATRDFYVDLLGLVVAYDSDWFVNLRADGDSGAEIGIWRRDHELIPPDFRCSPRGVIVTFVVDDVDAVYDGAKSRGVDIVRPPTNLFYGQRSMLVIDPNGVLVDVSTPSGEYSEAFLAGMAPSAVTE